MIPPGEPNLVTALVKATSARGARNVYQCPGVSGWHTSDVTPRGIPAYFRVSGPNIWIRTAEKGELLIAKVVGGKIVWEKGAEKFCGAV